MIGGVLNKSKITKTSLAKTTTRSDTKSWMRDNIHYISYILYNASMLVNCAPEYNHLALAQAELRFKRVLKRYQWTRARLNVDVPLVWRKEPSPPP